MSESASTEPEDKIVDLDKAHKEGFGGWMDWYLEWSSIEQFQRERAEATVAPVTGATALQNA